MVRRATRLRKAGRNAIERARSLVRQDEAEAAGERSPPGRPGIWSQEMEDRLFSRMLKGRTMTRICRDDADMPSLTTVYNWMDRDEKFLQRVSRARRLQAHTFVDDTLEIADDSSQDWTERTLRGGHVIDVPNDELIRRSAIRIETRKWVASKFNRDAYGDRQQLNVGGPNGELLPLVTKEDLIASLLAMAPKLVEKRAAIEAEKD